MPRWGAIRFGLTLALASALAGCAMLFPYGPGGASRCADTPKNVVEAFLRGIVEFNLFLIRAMVPTGVSPFAVFGDGDAAHGREIARQLFQHPEVIPPGSSVGMVPSLVDMEYVGEGQWRVTIQREDLVTADGRADEVRVYQRVFLARFDPESQCITAVRALEPAWRRCPEPRCR